jgi:uncharacterized protein
MSVKTWHILEPDECWALLEVRHLGRLAFVDPDGPIVLPVNYAMVNGVVIFRTDAGSKLDAVVRGDRLAFEIDGFDAVEQVGWSVLVRGMAGLVTDETELGLLRSMPLVSWAPGVKPIYVRLGSAEVTGRRITAPDLPAHWWG